VYDVKDTLIGKQEKLENTSNLNIKSLNVLSDFGAIIVETAGQIACDILSSGTLSTNGDASIGGKLTAPSGNIETFTAYTLNAFSCTLDTFNAQFINLVGNLDMTGTLTIGGETLDSKLSGKQDILTAGSGITIDASTNVISSTGGGGTTIDSTTDLSCNTLTTTGDVSIGGIITSPNQIGVLAFSKSGSVISGAGTKLPYGETEYNIGGHYNTSTYVFTCPVAGRYYVYASYYTILNQGGTIDLIRKRGSTTRIISRSQEGPNPPGNNEKRQLSVIIDCNVNDEVYSEIANAQVRLRPNNTTSDEIINPFVVQFLG
jgi:hypothetical protein